MSILRDISASENGRIDSTDGRVGVPAGEIPAGFALPAFLLNDINPEYPNRLYSFKIVTPPAAGKLSLDKRGVGSFTDAPPGTYTGSQIIEKYDPGVGLVASASSTYSLTIKPNLPDIQVYRAGTNGMGGIRSEADATAPMFPDVRPDQSLHGGVDHRCEYVCNTSPDNPLFDVVLWLSENTDSPGTVIEVGRGTSAVNGIEQAIDSSSTAPAGVLFSLVSGRATALALGDLPPGASCAVWYRRTVTAGLPPALSDTFTRSIEGLRL